MTQELSTLFDKSFQGKWRGRFPEDVKLKWPVEQEYANQIMAKDDKFEKCTGESIQQAMMSAAMIGLSLSPQMQHLYLIPRWNKDIKKFQAQLLVSYKGMMDVVNRTGHVLSVKAKVVYSNEAFEYLEGTTTEIRHKPIPDAKKRGVMIGAYCVAKLQDGELLVEYMDSEMMDRVKNASESKNSDYSPWNKWPEEMWKKAVVRRAWKYWPKSLGLDGLVEVMNRYEGIKFNETGRKDSDEPVVMISEEQVTKLHTTITENLPDADADKWLKRLAGSMGESRIQDLPESRYEEAEEALRSAIMNKLGD